MANFNQTYKLTDVDMRTYGGMQWKLNEWHAGSGVRGMCQDGTLHAYPHPLLAVFLNPVHANIQQPRLFKAEAGGKEMMDSGLKVGFSSMRLIEEIKLPHIDQEHRIRLALMASIEVCSNKHWCAYAQGIITGSEMTLNKSFNSNETDVERMVRNYAYNAQTYEEVEKNSGMALQTAAQYKSFDTIALCTEAYGQVYYEEAMNGTIYGASTPNRSK